MFRFACNGELDMAELRCQRQPWKDGVEVVLLVKQAGRTMIADPLTLRELKEGEYIADPTMRLENDEAQMLMDELWRCGLRPSEGSGSAGSLAATERHLKDMQKIAYMALDKAMPNAELRGRPLADGPA